MPQIEIRLNLQAVVARVNRKLDEISRHVSNALHHLPNVGNSYPSLAPEGPALQFNSGLTWTDEQARAAWKQWILSNGFRDIAEVISGVLEEAFSVLSLYRILDKQQSGTAVSSDDYAMRDNSISSFHRLTLTEKLRVVESDYGMVIPPKIKEQIVSINLARNCLAHREGIVAPRDTNADDTLSVHWEGVDFIVVTEGKEVPFRAPMHVEHGGTLHIRTSDRKRKFAVGEKISFEETEFSEIAWTMANFAQAVAKGLQTQGETRGIAFKEASV